MPRILASLGEDALKQTASPKAEAALVRWSETATSATGAPSDPKALASEAAFAAAARIALESRVSEQAVDLADFLPHLYSSPLFRWYRPESELEKKLRALLSPDGTTSSAELIGWLYQFSIPEEVRKRFGHFYTQPAIVAAMLDGIGFKGPKTLASRFLDPAVGAGAFAIEGSRRVIAAAEAEGLRGADVCRAVQRVIHGLDLNPLGILLTEAAIALLLAPHLRAAGGETLEPLHLYVTDSLREGELRAEAHGEAAEAIKSREGEYAEGFGYVVANPPYAKYPSNLLSDAQKRRFAATTYGHPNLYGLFLQVGVELLAEDGRLAFINPKSFVSGLYFRNLRRFLVDKLDLESFDTFSRRTGLFDGVLQDVVILSARKRRRRLKTIRLREFADAPDQPPVRSIKAPTDSVLLGPRFDRAFFISADELAHRLLAKMIADSVSLSEAGFEAVTGTVVWNRLRPHMRDQAAADALPLIWGNGIRPFRFAGLGNRAGEATHAALVSKTEGIVTRGEALLVKRMTAKEEQRRLVACRVPEQLERSRKGYFAENHVNTVRATGSNEIALDAILGLLNSRLYDYVFRSLNGNTQVSASEIEMLPIRQGPELETIGEAARELTARGGAVPATLERLDRLVCELFGFGAEEQEALLGTAEVAPEAAVA